MFLTKRLALVLAFAAFICVAGGQNVDLNNWTFASWGNNHASGLDAGAYLRASISDWRNGDAKWCFEPVAVKGNYRYSFEDEYSSNVSTRIVVFAENESGVETYINAGYAIPASDWRSYETVFATPADAKNVTVYHLLENNGWLQTRNYRLTESGPAAFNQGVVSLDFDIDLGGSLDAIVSAMNGTGYPATVSIITEGHSLDSSYPQVSELKLLNGSLFTVASHSKSHPHAWGASNARLADEVGGSRSFLDANGIESRIFAYPYGEYDQEIAEAVKNSGYSAARSSDEGFNFKGADPYRLYVRSVKNNVSAAQVREWIDYSVENRLWLILLFYRLDKPGVEYSTDQEVLRSTLEYLRIKKIDVVSEMQGVKLIS